MSAWAEYLHLMIVLIAIVDIPGNLPMFLQRTGAMTRAERQQTALTAAVATAAILLVFAFFGETILETFGITIAAFKILGGLVILLMALEMLGLMGDPSVDHGGSGDSPVAVGVFPMAVPLFAGPGAISAVMVFAHHSPEGAGPGALSVLAHDAVLGAVIVSVAVLILLGLVAASRLDRFLTPLVQDVLNRLLGIIVGALGVEFMLEGVAAFFPALTGA